MPQIHTQSSMSKAGALQKLREAMVFLKWRIHSAPIADKFDPILNPIEEYRGIYARLTGKSFSSARVLEIGYGAHPIRMIALMSMGIDVHGIDLDMPMLRFSPSRLIQILRTNGLERALKTAVRSLLFDRKEQADLRLALQTRGFAMSIEESRFLVGDAARFDYGPEPIDLIYSEDVFEHIAPESLELLMQRLASVVSSDAVLLIRPNIFTGITGGHLPEWYEYEVDQSFARRSEPWEHLRKRRYTANTYRNHLSRAEYRRLFSRHFDILEEKVTHPMLGVQWMTPEIRAELSTWSDEELFSNTVQFVLRPRTARA
ncbi:MAG: class I SAM-dependent methyltransferase [Acidobacteriota bacterium]|nr:class I SAM-dependent methyltransferase [Acidobacteriota bacterium]